MKLVWIFRKMAHLAYFWLLPFKGVDYFDLYVRSVCQQAAQHGTNVVVTIVNTALALKIVHFLYLGLYSSNSDLQDTIHFDGFHLLLGKRQMNLCAVGVICMTINSNWTLFQRPDKKLLELLHRVLVHSDGGQVFCDIDGSTSRDGRRVMQEKCAKVRKTYLVSLKAHLLVLFSSGKKYGLRG